MVAGAVTAACILLSTLHGDGAAATMVAYTAVCMVDITEEATMAAAGAAGTVLTVFTDREQEEVQKMLLMAAVTTAAEETITVAVQGHIMPMASL
jgi:hypothetical protein